MLWDSGEHVLLVDHVGLAGLPTGSEPAAAWDGCPTMMAVQNNDPDGFAKGVTLVIADNAIATSDWRTGRDSSDTSSQASAPSLKVARSCGAFRSD